MAITINNDKGKYIGYCRVSTQYQRQNNSLNNQKKTITDFINEKGGKLIEIYEDCHSSLNQASNPVIKNVIALCKKQGASLVVTKIDRLARDNEFIKQLIEDEELSVIFCEQLNLSKTEVLEESKSQKQYIKNRNEIVGAALGNIKKRGGRLGTPSNLTQEQRRKGAYTNFLKATNNKENRKIAIYAYELYQDGMNLNSIHITVRSKGMQTSNGVYPSRSCIKNLIGRHVFGLKSGEPLPPSMYSKELYREGVYKVYQYVGSYRKTAKYLNNCNAVTYNKGKFFPMTVKRIVDKFKH